MEVAWPQLILSQTGRRTQRGRRFTGGDVGPNGSYEEARVWTPGSAHPDEVLNDRLWWELGGSGEGGQGDAQCTEHSRPHL